MIEESSEDDDLAVWLHHINALKGWAEASAIVFMVLAVAMAAN